MDKIANIVPVNIEDEMRKSYMDYAMSVIIGRALPDVRDGLKPVQRRILYAMDDMGLQWNKQYKKSARLVGDVIGKYHPHGDSAVYEATVRMAQDFSLRNPLVDGQGNFGSMDGDPPAAMRYTEIKLARIASEMLADIDKETVNFTGNYDNSLQEPVILPSKVPNLADQRKRGHCCWHGDQYPAAQPGRGCGCPGCAHRQSGDINQGAYEASAGARTFLPADLCTAKRA